jgi:hypothetical protein
MASNDDTIYSVLDQVGDGWTSGRPEQIAETEAVLGVPLPPELRAFYETVDGGYIGEVMIFGLDDVRVVNPEYRAWIPSGVFFAADGGQGFFFVDADGGVDAPGAVLWTDRGVCIPDDCVPCAPSLVELLRALGAGARPWNGDSLRDRAMEAMQLALAAAPDRWHASAQADVVACRKASGRLVAKVRELEHLAAVADGLIVPAAGVTLRPLERIEPVDGAQVEDGLTGALWIGERSDGTRLALTVRGWREPNGGRVLAVAPGQDPKDAPVLGSLPEVVRGWLAGGPEGRMALASR